jgi:serine/threonine protein phosphatase PrpC
MSDDLTFTFAHGTDVGRVREHNEDSVAITDPTDAALKRKGRLFIVADGMGGYQAGEVASQIAAETVQREYYADPSDDPVKRLQNAVQKANNAVYDSAHSDRARAGMGTTIVAMAIVGRKAYLASVGDSRAYIVHQSDLVQITQDHSLVGEQVRAGLLTKEQARTHPQRNVITRALGSQPSVQVDTFEGNLSEGDVMMMCTDGLTGHVPEEHIRTALDQLPPEQAVRQLIELANQGGGTDNISTIVIRTGPTHPTEAKPDTDKLPSKTQPVATVAIPGKRRISLVWVAAGAVSVLIALVALGAMALAGGFVLERTLIATTPTLAATFAPASVTPLIRPTIASPIGTPATSPLATPSQ